MSPHSSRRPQSTAAGDGERADSFAWALLQAMPDGVVMVEDGGLSLQGATEEPLEVLRRRASDAVDALDEAARELRATLSGEPHPRRPADQR